MMEHKRANEDRLQDNFEELLSRSGHSEKVKEGGAENVMESKSPLTSVIAPNLLYMATDIIIPCEIINEDEETTLTVIEIAIQSDESAQVAECDSKSAHLKKAGIEEITATRYEEITITNSEFSFEQTVRDNIAKVL
jgi:hypothetical protein